MMDQNKPARFLDTAYNALKANPGATNQILQAAAQGQPVGLRGLAAAAAQQNQQEAQQAMAAQQMQAQGPQQSIIQKLAGASGIMGQLPSSLQLASAPTGPASEEMPQQMMAGGGLVSFADGGNVLPPDVIEAIQSHFAHGGEVRGFPVGGPVEMEDDILRKIFAGGRDPKNFAQSERMKEIIARNADNPSKDQIEDILRRMVEGPPADVEPSTYSQRGVRSTLTLPGETPPPSPDADLNAIRQQNYMRQVTGNAPVEAPAYGQRATRSLFTPSEAVPSVSPDADIGKAIQEAHMRNVTGNAPEPPAYQMRAATRSEPYSYRGTPATNPRAPLDVRSLSPEAEAYLARAGQGLEELAPVAEKGVGYLSKMGKAAGALGRFAGPLGYASSLAEVGDIIANPENRANFAEDWQREMPTWLGGSEKAKPYIAQAKPELGTAQYPYEEEESEEQVDEPILRDPSLKKAIQPKTWKPEPHDGHEVTPRQRVIEEGTKVDKKFEEAKKDVPSAATTPVSEQVGGLTALGGLGDMEKMRDLIMSLGGHKEMSPEILQKLGDLEGSARTSTILQSALGALGAGLSDPYGGRYALGRAALGALSGYQKGIGSEEEIGRKAFDVLRGYADAPEEEKTAARDKLFDIAKKSAELQSEERRSALRGVGGLSFEERMLLKQAGDPRKGLLTQGDIANAKAQALKMTEDWAKTQAANPPFKVPTDAEKMNKTREFMLQILPATDERTIGGLGANIGAAQSSGLGGGTPRIYQ